MRQLTQRWVSIKKYNLHSWVTTSQMFKLLTVRCVIPDSNTIKLYIPEQLLFLQMPTFSMKSSCSAYEACTLSIFFQLISIWKCWSQQQQKNIHLCWSLTAISNDNPLPLQIYYLWMGPPTNKDATVPRAMTPNEPTPSNMHHISLLIAMMHQQVKNLRSMWISWYFGWWTNLFSPSVFMEPIKNVHPAI